jgi:hypothetical protein
LSQGGFDVTREFEIPGKFSPKTLNSALCPPHASLFNVQFWNFSGIHRKEWRAVFVSA